MTGSRTICFRRSCIESLGSLHCHQGKEVPLRSGPEHPSQYLALNHPLEELLPSAHARDQTPNCSDGSLASGLMLVLKSLHILLAKTALMFPANMLLIKSGIYSITAKQNIVNLFTDG